MKSAKLRDASGGAKGEFYIQKRRIVSICLIFLSQEALCNNINNDTDFSTTRLTKTFLEPCDIIYTQVYCDEENDDEDYGLEEECSPLKSDNCDRSLKLYCNSGVCLPNCHPVKEYYDHILGKCFRKIGSDCRQSDECDQNAVCERRQCRCAKNYTLEPESGKCVRASEFGERCDSEVICDMLSDLVCRNNSCECRSPQAQYYHSKRKRCYLKIGEDCANKFRSFQLCPDNSNCLREFEENSTQGMEEEPYINILGDEDKVFKCKCTHGHAPTEDLRFCQGLYGTSCNSLHKCNTERSLKCYNTGICQCSRPKDQVFSQSQQKCVTLLGSVCNVGNSSCVDWAECKQDFDKGISTCECVNGFIKALDSEVCLKDHGVGCLELDLDGNGGLNLSGSVEPECNIFVGLECSNSTGTCQCKDPNQFYDVGQRFCRDFEVAQRHIPVKHFDTADREYLFHERNRGNGNKDNFFAFYILGLIYYLFIANLCQNC